MLHPCFLSPSNRTYEYKICIMLVVTNRNVCAVLQILHSYSINFLTNLIKNQTSNFEGRTKNLQNISIGGIKKKSSQFS